MSWVGIRGQVNTTHWENAFWLLDAFVWILDIWIIRIDRSDTHLLWCWPFSVTQERAMCGSLTRFNSLQMGLAFLPSFLYHCSLFCIWGVGGVGSRSHYVAQVGPSCLHFPNAGVIERPVPFHGSCPALIFLFAGCVCGGVCLQNSGLSGSVLVIPEFAGQIIKSKLPHVFSISKNNQNVYSVMNNLYLGKW